MLFTELLNSERKWLACPECDGRNLEAGKTADSGSRKLRCAECGNEGWADPI